MKPLQQINIRTKNKECKSVKKQADAIGEARHTGGWLAACIPFKFLWRCAKLFHKKLMLFKYYNVHTETFDGIWSENGLTNCPANFVILCIFTAAVYDCATRSGSVTPPLLGSMKCWYMLRGERRLWRPVSTCS